MVLDPTSNDRVVAVSESGCWIWIGAMNGNGYGSLRLNGKPWTAHRLAAHLRGEDIAGKDVCHRCDQTLCCNPDHLFVGTRGDNNRDRERKGRGRQPSGEKHPMAKTTADVARQVFLDPCSIAEAARKYCVSQHTAYNIRNRKQWRRATEGLVAPQYWNEKKRIYGL